MHTTYRFLRSSLSFLWIEAMFGAWGVCASFAAGNAGPLIVVLLWSTVFFAPAGFAQTWDDIGD